MAKHVALSVASISIDKRHICCVWRGFESMRKIQTRVFEFGIALLDSKSEREKGMLERFEVG